jgi:hypothetical protein
MIEVTGKTIGELQEVSERDLDDNFMFLGCSGSTTSYSTRRTTYGVLKHDLSAVFMDHLAPNISERLDKLDHIIDAGDGTPYF